MWIETFIFKSYTEKVPLVGIEPTTFALEGRRSSTEL